MRFWRWIPGFMAGFMVMGVAVGVLAEEWTLDAADGEDLAARIEELDYAAGDTVTLFGRFASVETIFPRAVDVVLGEDTIVYGDLRFPEGGSLTGDYESTQVFGAVRAGETSSLRLKNMVVAGCVWLGEPSDDAWEYEQWDEERPAQGQLRFEGETVISTGVPNALGVFSAGDVVLASDASVCIWAGSQDMWAPYAGTALRSMGDVWLGESADLLAWSGGTCITAYRDIVLADYAYMMGTAGYAGHAIRAEREIAVGRYAKLSGNGLYSSLGCGREDDIYAVSLRAAPGAFLEATAWGISVEHLSVDPTATIDTPELYFRIGAQSMTELTFQYSEEPPEIRAPKETGGRAALEEVRVRLVKREDDE